MISLNKNYGQRTINEKEQIEQLRKVLPQLVAETLVSVQPMQGSVGKVFTLRHVYKTWVPVFLLWPRKTIHGGWTWGHAYFRNNKPTEYMSQKEMFISKLKGDESE